MFTTQLSDINHGNEQSNKINKRKEQNEGEIVQRIYKLIMNIAKEQREWKFAVKSRRKQLKD